MTYLTDLEQLVANAALPHLNGFAAGGVRSKVLDVFARGDISASEAFSLLEECDRRIDAEGVRFGNADAATETPATPAPQRVDLPAPYVLDEEAIRFCARARWTPDETVKAGETLAEQGSRVMAFVLACRQARLDGRDLEPRDKRAIWAAVAGQVALVARRKGAA